MTATGEISEKQARDVAEHGRAKEWLAPSFAKELFLDRLFDALWRNCDDSDRRLARQVLDGRYTWLEEGILDPSIEGPWIAHDGGTAKSDVHRVIRDAKSRGAA